MLQAAPSHVMDMFHTPDVDLLEQICTSTTVRQAPNDAESATIIFDTVVAQGRIASPQLFNIFNKFINTLLRMMKSEYQPWFVTGQNQSIDRGLQIGKNQKDSSQDADHRHQFEKHRFYRRHVDVC